MLTLVCRNAARPLKHDLFQVDVDSVCAIATTHQHIVCKQKINTICGVFRPQKSSPLLHAAEGPNQLQKTLTLIMCRRAQICWVVTTPLTRRPDSHPLVNLRLKETPTKNFFHGMNVDNFPAPVGNMRCDEKGRVRASSEDVSEPIA